MGDDVLGKLFWCSKQKKGIKITNPNDNLCDAYIKKSHNSLKSMNVNMKEGIYDWAVDAAYYSRYQAIYALLQKCGIDSEIHDCSILLIEFLFENKLDLKIIKEIQQSKKQRIDLIYYTNRLVPLEDIKENVNFAPNFVLVIEKLISTLDADQIEEIRRKLKKVLEG